MANVNIPLANGNLQPPRHPLGVFVGVIKEATDQSGKEKKGADGSVKAARPYCKMTLVPDPTMGLQPGTKAFLNLICYQSPEEAAKGEHPEWLVNNIFRMVMAVRQLDSIEQARALGAFSGDPTTAFLGAQVYYEVTERIEKSSDDPTKTITLSDVRVLTRPEVVEMQKDPTFRIGVKGSPAQAPQQGAQPPAAAPPPAAGGWAAPGQAQPQQPPQGWAPPGQAPGQAPPQQGWAPPGQQPQQGWTPPAAAGGWTAPPAGFGGQ